MTMQFELLENLYMLSKYITLCPIAGYMMYLCLFNILSVFAADDWNEYVKEIPTKGKIKCWFYLTVLAFVIAALFHCFAQRA